jgi:CRISPR-associated protein Cas1
MLVQYAYCPRLFYLEWVDGEFRHNVHTIEGKFDHRRSDSETETESWLGELSRRRSVSLSSNAERLSGRMDMVETRDGKACPVEIKHGKLPKQGPWKDHRVQVCAYALILRDNGYGVDTGQICYAGSRKRVPVDITPALTKTTRDLTRAALKASQEDSPPPPLQSSRKCEGCSLVPVCLPDEYWALEAFDSAGQPATHQRRIVPARDDCLPLYVQEQGSYVSRRGKLLKVTCKGEELGSIRLNQTSQVCLMGSGIQMSTQAVHSCLNGDVPILYFSSGGYYLGSTTTLSTRSPRIRITQYSTASDESASLAIARKVVSAKIHNSRTFLMRNAQDIRPGALAKLKSLKSEALQADSIESLLGLEGGAASIYFGEFSRMLKCDEGLRFLKRSRRPPKDEINAMLSYAYGMLVKDCTVALNAAGFDPSLGFYHKPRPGRPGLALDLMEIFRPLIADSAVLFAANSGMVRPTDFMSGAGSVGMKKRARKAVIRSYERRMEQMVTHPVFDYRLSYRRVLEIESRLISRLITGELDEYRPFTTR